MPNGKRNLPKHVQNFYQILNGPFNFFQSFKILTKWQNFAKSGHTDFECTHCCCWWSVCTDWAIFCSLGNHSKPVATIILSILPTLLGNFCKGIKIIHFPVKSFWATLIDIWRFISGHTAGDGSIFWQRQKIFGKQLHDVDDDDGDKDVTTRTIRLGKICSNEIGLNRKGRQHFCSKIHLF